MWFYYECNHNLLYKRRNQKIDKKYQISDALFPGWLDIFRYKFLCVLRPYTYINFSDLRFIFQNVSSRNICQIWQVLEKAIYIFSCSFYLKIYQIYITKGKVWKVRIILAIKLICYLIYSSSLCMKYLNDITLPHHVNISCKVWVLCGCKI